MSEEEGFKVVLHCYDLSQGMARQLSRSIIGREMEAIWHTGIVVFGKEWFWGGFILEDLPARTPYGTPQRTVDLGTTYIPESLFREFVEGIKDQYTPASYDLLSKNCNNFTSEVSQFLLGKDIPSDIVGMPEEFLSTPIGQMLKPIIEQFQTQVQSQMGFPPNTQVPIQAARESQPTVSISTPKTPMATDTETTTIPPAPKKETKRTATSTRRWLLQDAQPLLSSQGAAGPMICKLFALVNEDEKNILIQIGDYMDKKGTFLPPDAPSILMRLLTSELPTGTHATVWYLLRLVVLKKEGQKLLFSANLKSDVAKVVCRDVVHSSKPLKLMAMTAASNTFAHGLGAAFLCQSGSMQRESLLKICCESLSSEDLQLQLMGGAIVYNYCLFLRRCDVSSMCYDQSLTREIVLDDELQEMLLCIYDRVMTLAPDSNSNILEVVFRCLMAIGQLIQAPYGGVTALNLLKELEFEASVLTVWKDKGTLKVREVVDEIFKIFRS